MFRFTLTESTRVLLQATEKPETTGGWSPCIALLPDLLGGAPIAENCHLFRPRLDEVLNAGTYYVEVRADNDISTGEYELLYQPLRPAEAIAPVPDVPMAAQISFAGDVDPYTFTLAERTRVILQATEKPETTGGWSPCIDVLPDLVGGTPIAADCHLFRPRLDVVLDPGTYYVTVYNDLQYLTGDYEVLYQSLVFQ